jgi:hypothetical protein
VQALRFNCVEAMDAARSGTLLTLLHARGNTIYSKIVTLNMLDYGPILEDGKRYGRATAEVIEQRAQFLCGGESGQMGHLQPVDLLHEEAERSIHLLGPGITEAGCLGVTGLFDIINKLRATCMGEFGISERAHAARSHPPSRLDKEGDRDKRQNAAEGSR